MTLASQDRREFIIKLSSWSALISTGTVLSACGGGDGARADFLYGVASGDPLSDRVVLWTHAKFPGDNSDVTLNYEVATDNAFINRVSSGVVVASASSNFTAKVDATGLQAGQSYFYRFMAGATSSPVGKNSHLAVQYGN